MACDRKEKDEAMMGLLVFAVEKPRQKERTAADEEKNGGGRNTTKHAASVVATVRELYAQERNRRV